MAEQVAVSPAGSGLNPTSDISFSMLSVVANVEICFRLLSFIDPYHFKQKQFTDTIKTTTLTLLISVFYFTKEQDNCVDNGPESVQEGCELI